MLKITVDEILALIDQSSQIDVRGGEGIVPATWFSGEGDGDDEDPLHIDAEGMGVGAAVSRSDLEGAARNDSGEVVLVDGRVIVFYATLVA